MNDDLLLPLSADSATPTRADAVQNRADILAAARALFTQLGVENVSMSEVGRAAGVGKGTLYRHFRGKADLCLALLDNDQRDLQNTVLTHLRTTADSPCDLLVWFLQQIIAFTGRTVDLLAEVSEERASIAFDDPAHHWQYVTIHGLLLRAGVTGDADYAADALYALLDARLYRFYRDVRGYSHQRISDGVGELARRLLIP